MTDADTESGDLDDTERAALHSVELGVEWLHRAHGDLVRFHHQIGHAMDHLADAETEFREAGYDGLADAIRDEYLPRGVIDDNRWSYDVLETYEDGFLADLTAFETETRETVADGRRHVTERRQERVWKQRAADLSAAPETTDDRRAADGSSHEPGGNSHEEG